MNRRAPALAAFALACFGFAGCGPKQTAEPQADSPEAEPQKYWKLTEARYGAWGDAPDAPELGDKVEDFELPDADGGSVKLSTVLAAGKPVVLLFYRGFW